MIVQSIEINHFRNHTQSVLEFSPGTNILLGRNAQGKTNILEAISCLCLTKSFYGASDTTLVQLGKQGYDLGGRVSTDSGVEYDVSLVYNVERKEKQLAINKAKVESLTNIVGMFPVVILSPESNAITFGGPSDRRRFLDLLLSQLSRSYLDHLLEYRHTLKQRNRILADAKQQGVIRNDVLEPWNLGIAKHGARILQHRIRRVEEFGGYVQRSHVALAGSHDEPRICYATDLEITRDTSVEAAEEKILNRLDVKRSEECRRGVSLVGPHRDDLTFTLNDIELQKYASQGQHKTFLIALKTAEFSYLKDKKDESPILLLDDVLSELDGERSRRLLHHISELGQTVITTTDETPFHGTVQWGYEHRKFHVEEGTCTRGRVNVDQEAAVGVS